MGFSSLLVVFSGSKDFQQQFSHWLCSPSWQNLFILAPWKRDILDILNKIKMTFVGLIHKFDEELGVTVQYNWGGNILIHMWWSGHFHIIWPGVGGVLKILFLHKSKSYFRWSIFWTSFRSKSHFYIFGHVLIWLWNKLDAV